MKISRLALIMTLFFTQPLFSHDAEVTRQSVCKSDPGLYFLKIDKVFYRTTVTSKGGLIFIDNPPLQAAGGLCYCRDQEDNPPILVCD